METAGIAVDLKQLAELQSEFADQIRDAAEADREAAWTLLEDAFLELTSDATFFFGAWVDYTDRIVEGNSDNNLWWTDARSTELLAPLSLAEAVGGRVDSTIPHAAAWVPASVTTRPDGSKGVMPHFISRQIFTGAGKVGIGARDVG